MLRVVQKQERVLVTERIGQSSWQRPVSFLTYFERRGDSAR